MRIQNDGEYRKEILSGKEASMTIDQITKEALEILNNNVKRLMESHHASEKIHKQESISVKINY